MEKNNVKKAIVASALALSVAMNIALGASTVSLTRTVDHMTDNNRSYNNDVILSYPDTLISESDGGYDPVSISAQDLILDKSIYSYGRIISAKTSKELDLQWRGSDWFQYASFTNDMDSSEIGTAEDILFVHFANRIIDARNSNKGCVIEAAPLASIEFFKEFDISTVNLARLRFKCETFAQKYDFSTYGRIYLSYDYFSINAYSDVAYRD